MQWRQFEFEGKIYDLRHLHPISIRYEQSAKGDRPALFYNVDIIFSLHCFTRGFQPGEEPETALFYGDARETRIFDFQRYELSKRLPEIIQDLPRRKCYHTGKGNFFPVDIINAEDRSFIEYDIFFTASRSARKKGIINLYVQSAYVRDTEHGSNRPREKPIAFNIILSNTLNKRPIHPPK
jgi:hypothetical protein